MAATFRRTVRTSRYYRTLEAGSVQAGNLICLIERSQPDWSLDRLIKTRFDAKLRSSKARELSISKTISESWRTAFRKNQNRGFEKNPILD